MRRFNVTWSTKIVEKINGYRSKTIRSVKPYIRHIEAIEQTNKQTIEIIIDFFGGYQLYYPTINP